MASYAWAWMLKGKKDWQSPLTLLAQTFTYAPINVPGAAATEARGINTSGEVVGFYKSASCTDHDVKVPNCPTHGFKYFATD